MRDVGGGGNLAVGIHVVGEICGCILAKYKPRDAERLKGQGLLIESGL